MHPDALEADAKGKDHRRVETAGWNSFHNGQGDVAGVVLSVTKMFGDGARINGSTFSSATEVLPEPSLWVSRLAHPLDGAARARNDVDDVRGRARETLENGEGPAVGRGHNRSAFRDKWIDATR